MKGTYDNSEIAFSVMLRGEIFGEHGLNISESLRLGHLNSEQEFEITVCEKPREFSLQSVYGANPYNLAKKLGYLDDEPKIRTEYVLRQEKMTIAPVLTLIGKRNIKALANNESAEEISEFKNIPFIDKATFEDAIQDYLKANYEQFDPVQKLHALSFLQRYCNIEYEELREIETGIKTGSDKVK